jgi:predicted nucleotidyltransferase component of viral defense system
MDRHSAYRRQVQLLISLLPLVAEHKCFALKGGTAINLFYKDLPRLSVDIDLVYLPLDDRNTSLNTINHEIQALSAVATQAIDATPDTYNAHHHRLA